MDPKLFATVFTAVFVAELGDKTQLATLLFAADAPGARLTVFLASAAALTLSAGIGVLGGAALAALFDPRLLRGAAALAFIAIGLWMLLPGRGES